MTRIDNFQIHLFHIAFKRTLNVNLSYYNSNANENSFSYKRLAPCRVQSKEYQAFTVEHMEWSLYYLKYQLLDLLSGKRSFKMKVNVQHNSLRRAIESSTGVCSWGQTVGSFLSRTG